MLTLAGPVGVASSKSGRSASVAGDPVQAETALSANNVTIDEARTAFTSLFDEIDKIIERRGLPIELSMRAVHMNMHRPKPRTSKLKSTCPRVNSTKSGAHKVNLRQLNGKIIRLKDATLTSTSRKLFRGEVGRKLRRGSLSKMAYGLDPLSVRPIAAIVSGAIVGAHVPLCQ
jgi:hypothetical protein